MRADCTWSSAMSSRAVLVSTSVNRSLVMSRAPMTTMTMASTIQIAPLRRNLRSLMRSPAGVAYPVLPAQQRAARRTAQHDHPGLTVQGASLRSRR